MFALLTCVVSSSVTSSASGSQAIRAEGLMFRKSAPPLPVGLVGFKGLEEP
jgi:hypothetical protein